jgi:hypothetical protein
MAERFLAHPNRTTSVGYLPKEIQVIGDFPQKITCWMTGSVQLEKNQRLSYNQAVPIRPGGSFARVGAALR